MPERGKTLIWARKTVGVKEILDLSLPSIEKIEAIKLYHQFVLHGRENPVEPEILDSYLAKIKNSLSNREMVNVNIMHNRSDAHKF